MINRRRALAAWSLAYLLAMFGVWQAMATARARVLATLDTPAAQREWQQWRDDIQRQVERGETARRVPASAEPPAVLLMRDYYASCLAITLTLSTALFWVTALLVHGALFRGQPAAGGARSNGASGRAGR